MTAAVSTGSISPFAVFKNRGFSLLWTGQLISTMGSALTSLAASILVYRLTNSAMSVGLMLMATAAPTVLVGLFAGVFVDRFDRKKIMIAADLIRAVLVFLIPALVPHSIVWLYVIVMISSAVGQFYDPAHESVLPEVAADEELAAANSLMVISSFGSTALGFAASGLIAGAADIKWAFYLDALSFLLSAACVFMIQIKPIVVEENATPAVVLRNLRAGIRFLFDSPILRSLFFVSIPVLIGFGLSNSLLLPFALSALKATEFEYGIQEGMTSLGFVAGSLLMAAVFDRMREGAWIALSFIGMAIVGILFSFVNSVPLAIALLTISGFVNAPSAIARRLVLQRNTPREMRGRVTSAFFVARDVFFLIGMASAGLADLINVRVMYLFSALLILSSGIWALFLPGLRQAAEDWKRALKLLRTAPTAPGLGAGRPATLADLDLLVGLLPSLSGLSQKDRQSLVSHAQVIEAPAGTTIIKHGEAGDAAYFILSGKAVAGIAVAGTAQGEGKYRSLSSMTAGDYFGEIAALTGAPRTADVVVEESSSLLQVPAQALRALMGNPALSQLFLTRMSERLARTSINELPRFAGLDQQALRELRTAPVAE
jgi:DHA3 family macrolide efflux protein-like MFS transporter